MTVLEALDRYYHRMAARGDVTPPGWSVEPVGVVIVLGLDGSIVDVFERLDEKGKRLGPRLLAVPAAVKRTAGIRPNLFWDKSAYVLGRTAGEGKRTAQEHEAFKAAHAALLAGATDPGLAALRRFLEHWTPERFDAPPFEADMLDANLVFRVEGDRRFIHEREAARAVLAAGAVQRAGSQRSSRA